jgi:hypothetical protein
MSTCPFDPTIADAIVDSGLAADLVGFIGSRGVFSSAVYHHTATIRGASGGQGGLSTAYKTSSRGWSES